MRCVKSAKVVSKTGNKNRSSRCKIRKNRHNRFKRHQSVSQNVEIEMSGKTYQNKGFKIVSYAEKAAPLNFTSVKFNLLSLTNKIGGNLKLLHKIARNKLSRDDLLLEVKNMSEHEINMVFLWSAFCKKWELLEELIDRGAKPVYSEPTYGFTALHLVAFSGCVEGARFLCRKINVNIIKKRYSPLHAAAFMDNASVAEVLLDFGARINSLNNGPGYETPLHIAIKSNSIDCADLLIRRGAVIYERGKLSDLSPLFLTIELGYTECLKSMLRYNGQCIARARKRTDGNTALHLAALADQFQCIQILLENGINPDLTNFKKETALHLAVRCNACCCVNILLQYQANPNGTDRRKRTPLHHAVESMTTSRKHIVKLLLNDGAHVNVTDEDGFSPLHLASLNGLPEYAVTLVELGADVTAKCRSNITAFGLMTRKTPSAIAAVKTQLDRSIVQMFDREQLIRTELQFDFKKGLQHPNEYELLNTFVLEGRPDLLLHPLCRAFLHVTWARLRRCYYGMVYSWIRLCLFLLFYMLTAMAYQCREDQDVLYCKSNSYMNDLLIRDGLSLSTQWYMLAYACGWILYTKMYDFLIYPSLKHYFISANNQMEWLSIIGVVAISPFYTGVLERWQMHVGAWTVLFCWANLMFVIGQLPLFGSYVEMYQKVQDTFFEILLTFAFFLIGYLTCFCLFLPNSSAFIDISMGAIGVLVLMVGDMNYDYFLNHKYLTSLSKVSAQITCFSFLIFVTIVVMNLLVGIAVDDIDTLQENADLSKLVAQFKLCLYIERSYLNRSHFFKFLFRLIRMIPKPYIGNLKVKPLDPAEDQLPKQIIQQAYDNVKQQHESFQSTVSIDENHVSFLKDVEHEVEDRLKLFNILRNDIRDCKQAMKQHVTL